MTVGGMSQWERRSFLRFMAVYLGAGLLVVAVLSYLFYRIEREAIRDRIFAGLRMDAMAIAASAVEAQMRQTPFRVPETLGCDYLLLGPDGKRVGGCLKGPVARERESYIQNGCAYVVDRSAHGHLGIDAVVVRDCRYAAKIRQSAFRVTAVGVGAYLFLIGVGWYLGRLFLEPMRRRVEAMDRFVKDATHELNTPVTILSLALQKIGDGKRCRPVYLEALHMSGRLIARVYEDLVFLLMEEASAKAACRERFDVAESVRSAAAFFRILAEKKGVRLEVEARSWTVFADPHHIDLLIKNLVDNALKYTRPGGSVKISLQSGVLEVEDTGVGIAREKLQRIFERFTRESDIEGGFGIGLSIVRRVCRLYGYRIAVDSREGEGSRFCVYFHSRE